VPPEPKPIFGGDAEAIRKVEAKLLANPAYVRLLKEEWGAKAPSNDWVLFLSGVSELLGNQRGKETGIGSADVKVLKSRKLLDAVTDVHGYLLHTGGYPADFLRRVELLLASLATQRVPRMGVWGIEEDGQRPFDFAALAVWVQRQRPPALAAPYQRELLAARRAGPVRWSPCKDGADPAPSRPYLTCEKEALEHLAQLTTLTAREQARLKYVGSMAYRGMPPAQQLFCDAVASASEEYANARAQGANELKLSKLRTKRRDGMQAAVADGVAKDWLGVVEQLKTNSDGKAILKVAFACGTAHGPVRFATWNNALSDIRDDTLIPQTSKVFNVLADLGERKPIKFSGSLLPEKLNGFKEESLTEGGSMDEPVFIFRFSSVAKL
jgi:hypothetical protein